MGLINGANGPNIIRFCVISKPSKHIARVPCDKSGRLVFHGSREAIMVLKNLLKGSRCSSLAFQAGSLGNGDLQDQVICHDVLCCHWFAHGIIGAQVQICTRFSFAISNQLDQHQFLVQWIDMTSLSTEFILARPPSISIALSTFLIMNGCSTLTTES